MTDTTTPSACVDCNMPVSICEHALRRLTGAQIVVNDPTPATVAPVTNDSRERPEWRARVFSSDLDHGIAVAVHLLNDHGVETYESCQGGADHGGGSGEWPVVRFYGSPSEGFRALSVALMYGLPVFELQRVWRMDNGEPTGPQWSLTFRPGEMRI